MPLPTIKVTVINITIPEEISIGTEPLVKCKSFKYLGCTVSEPNENVRLEGELYIRMGRTCASAVFGNLRERLLNS